MSNQNSQARISEDGHWFYTGSQWVPVPQVTTPEQPDPDEPDALPEKWVYVPTLTEESPVAFGEGITVDNAALRLINATRDRAYVLTFLSAALVALAPAVIETFQAHPRKSAHEHLFDTWLTDCVPFTAVVIAGSLLVLFLLRLSLSVRLFWAPLHQALLCVAVVSTSALYVFESAPL